MLLADEQIARIKGLGSFSREVQSKMDPVDWLSHEGGSLHGADGRHEARRHALHPRLRHRRDAGGFLPSRRPGLRRRRPRLSSGFPPPRLPLRSRAFLLRSNSPRASWTSTRRRSRRRRTSSPGTTPRHSPSTWTDVDPAVEPTSTTSTRGITDAAPRPWRTNIGGRARCASPDL